jgi:hypothetical protein
MANGGRELLCLERAGVADSVVAAAQAGGGGASLLQLLARVAPPAAGRPPEVLIAISNYNLIVGGQLNAWLEARPRSPGAWPACAQYRLVRLASRRPRPCRVPEDGPDAVVLMLRCKRRTVQRPVCSCPGRRQPLAASALRGEAQTARGARGAAAAAPARGERGRLKHACICGCADDRAAAGRRLARVG